MVKSNHQGFVEVTFRITIITFFIKPLFLRKKQANRNPEQTYVGSKPLAMLNHLSGFISTVCCLSISRFWKCPGDSRSHST